jgi:molybdenum cofactor guanylyltransferase
MNESVVGAVLAGGGSRRMGQDKAILPFRGKPLIQHVSDLLQSVFADVVIVSSHRQIYPFLRVPVLTDIIPDCGPLGGIYTALVHGGDRCLFVAACDLPLISPELIRYILDFEIPKDVTPGHLNPSEEPTAKIPVQDERLHPLCGWYSANCRISIEENLKQGQLKVQDFLQGIRMVPVPVSADRTFYRERLFYNINTMEKYRDLLQNDPLQSPDQNH